MTSRPLTPFLLFAAALALVGCEGSDAFPTSTMQATKATLRAAQGVPTTAQEEKAALLDREYPQLPEATDKLIAVAGVTTETVDGFPVLTFTPRDNARDLMIFYIHGGAYTYEFQSFYYDFLASLIERTGATVVVPIYPLAPEHTHREGFPFVRKAYQNAISSGMFNHIIFGGDSAGGGFALGLMMQVRDERQRMPEKAFLLSPWLDLTMSNPNARDLQLLDPLLSVDGLVQDGLFWAGGDDARDPHLSPLHGDLRALPPMVIVGGTDEVFLPDLRLFAAALDANVVHVTSTSTEAPASTSPHTYLEYPGAFHVFAGVPFLPEAEDAIDRLVTFILEE
jgi:acetyl esterase/lipase